MEALTASRRKPQAANHRRARHKALRLGFAAGRELAGVSPCFTSQQEPNGKKRRRLVLHLGLTGGLTKRHWG